MSSAAVLEFICLFTHDLKRKQKRWQDGRLKFHTFNKRIMVHDERGNYVGDSHWNEDYDLDDGEEISLERGGVIVQVAECTGSRQQDLTELVDKRMQEKAQRQAAASSRTSATPGTPAASNFQLRHRPLQHLIGTPTGHHGRALVPTESPYDARQQQLAAASTTQTQDGTSPRPEKRQRRDVSPPSKAGYAQNLFGATLTLSGAPMSSAPAMQRRRPTQSSATRYAGGGVSDRLPQSSAPSQGEASKDLAPSSSIEDSHRLGDRDPTRHAEPQRALASNAPVRVRAAPIPVDRGESRVQRARVHSADDSDDARSGRHLQNLDRAKQGAPKLQSRHSTTTSPPARPRQKDALQPRSVNLDMQAKTKPRQEKPQSRPDPIPADDASSGESSPETAACIESQKNKEKTKRVAKMDGTADTQRPASVGSSRVSANSKKAIVPEANLERPAAQEESTFDEPRTELRFKPKKKRGLLVVTERAPKRQQIESTENNPNKPRAQKASRKPHLEPVEIVDVEGPPHTAKSRPDVEKSKCLRNQEVYENPRENELSSENAQREKARRADIGKSIPAVQQTFDEFEDPFESPGPQKQPADLGSMSRKTKDKKNSRSSTPRTKDISDQSSFNTKPTLKSLSTSRRNRSHSKSENVGNGNESSSEAFEEMAMPVPKAQRHACDKKPVPASTSDIEVGAEDDGMEEDVPRRSKRQASKRRSVLSDDEQDQSGSADEVPAPRVAQLIRKSIRSRELIGFSFDEDIDFPMPEETGNLAEKEGPPKSPGQRNKLQSTRKGPGLRGECIGKPAQNEMSSQRESTAEPCGRRASTSSERVSNGPIPLAALIAQPPSPLHTTPSSETTRSVSGPPVKHGQDSSSQSRYSDEDPSQQTPNFGRPKIKGTEAVQGSVGDDASRDDGGQQGPSKKPADVQDGNTALSTRNVHGLQRRTNSAPVRSLSISDHGNATSTETTSAEPPREVPRRITNPATRGKKAARPSDAAGQIPQCPLPSDATPQNFHAPRPPARQLIAKKNYEIGIGSKDAAQQQLPGFARANGGAWSRESYDLFG